MTPKDALAAVVPHTDSSGVDLIRNALRRAQAVALVFTPAEEQAALSVGLTPVFVHDGDE